MKTRAHGLQKHALRTLRAAPYRAPLCGKLLACLFEPAKAIVRTRSPSIHGLNFAEHISKQALVALTRVVSRMTIAVRTRMSSRKLATSVIRRSF